MTDQKLITQLKTLKNIHPDSSWVSLTRSQFSSENSQMATNTPSIFERIFSLNIPQPLAISAMVVIVAIVGGISFVQNGNDNEGVFVYNTKPLSDETRKELKTIADDVRGRTPSALMGFGGTTLIPANQANEASYTVVFDEDSDAQENFKDALRNRIEGKVGRINDLFAQLEDGDLAREISLNQRRYEENFKLADEELGVQIRKLLADAEIALDGGNLIDALELVNAIERLLN